MDRLRAIVEPSRCVRLVIGDSGLVSTHGITNVGYWSPQESDPELGISADNTFVYIRGYPSKEERDKRLTAAHDDQIHFSPRGGWE
jgi:hypothetical protein